MIYHQVKPGEYLSQIRKKYKLNFVPFESIKLLNPQIKDINKIQPGWEIKLPSTLQELKAIEKIKTYQPPKLFTAPSIPGRPAVEPQVAQPYAGRIPARPKEELLLVRPEYIEKQKRPKEELVWEKAPTRFEKIKSEISLKAKELLKGEPREITALKAETNREYPLVPEMTKVIKGIDVKEKEREGAVAGTWSLNIHPIWGNLPMSFKERIGPMTHELVQNALQETRQLFRIGPEALTWDPAGKISLSSSKHEVLMHEGLHENFEKTVITPFGLKGVQAFNRAWEKAREDYPWETAIIDQVIVQRYGPIPSHLVANERYAWFGATFGKEGLEKFPRSLIPFYHGVFK